MIKKIKERCQQCNTTFIIPMAEIPLHVIEPGLLLCWQCCRKEHFWSEERCSLCSEKTMCRGRFLDNMIKQVRDTKGI